ncbi:MAG: hypothetical protein WKF79_00320 [Nocardioides sp.]
MDVDAGGNTYQSFADLDFASEYLGGDVLRAVPWALLNDEAKARALISATRMLLTLPWCETPPDPAEAVLPAVIREVTAMLAADLGSKPKLFADASGSSNVKSVKAGSAQVEFFAPVDGGAPIPFSLWNRLLLAGLVCLKSSVDSSVLDGPFVSGICGGGYRPLAGRLPWDWPVAAMDYD